MSKNKTKNEPLTDTKLGFDIESYAVKIDFKVKFVYKVESCDHAKFDIGST